VKEHLSEIDSICITGTASPEGSLQHNTYLAGIRCLRIAREFTDIIDKKLLKPNIIPEDSLKLSGLLDNFQPIFPHSDTHYKELYLPVVRAVYVRVYTSPRPVQSITEDAVRTDGFAIQHPDTVIIHDTVTVSTDCRITPLLSLKTNLLLDLFPYSPFGLSLSPNISAELYTHLWSTSIEFEYMFPWNSNHNIHKCFQILNGTAGIRKYLTGRHKEEYTGWFIGIYGNSGYYDLCKDAEHGWQGEHWGFGLTAGYVFRVSKHFKLEPYIRIGYIHTRYDSYHYGKMDNKKYYYDWTGRPSEFYKRRFSTDYIGPTMIGINIKTDLYIKR
jgi:hypothetical protein